MTLTQLRFVLKVEETKSINAAAKRLYVAQSSMSEAIRDLEDELGITIYNRSNRGITLTKEGEEFIRYARNVMLQYQLLLDHYNPDGNSIRDSFSVTLQHSMLASEIFAQIVQEFGMQDYEYSLLEASTNKVIDDVRNYRSELGLIYVSRYNRDMYESLFQREGLSFQIIGESKICIYLSETHPLAAKKNVTMADLEEYPCLIFDQDDNSSFFFYEETVMNEFRYQNVIRTYDRGTQLDLLQHINAYSIGTGKVSEKLLRSSGLKIVALDSEDVISLVYVTRKGAGLSAPGEAFIRRIRECF